MVNYCFALLYLTDAFVARNMFYIGKAESQIVALLRYHSARE